MKKSNKNKDEEEDLNNVDVDVDSGEESNNVSSSDSELVDEVENIYDVDEQVSDSSEDSEDEELYLISSDEDDQDKNYNYTINDTDLDEDEIILPDDKLILIEIHGEDPGFLYDKDYSITGIETSKPIMKIGNIFYQGEYSDTYGTQMFFKNIPKKRSNKSIIDSTKSEPTNDNNNNNNINDELQSKIENNENNNNNNVDNSNQDKDKETTSNTTTSRNNEKIEQLVYVNKTTQKLTFYKMEISNKPQHRYFQMHKDYHTMEVEINKNLTVDK
ncbi:hypothetical protein DLAC_04988 [Tieghemostelium lacteum]|uniref:Transcription factor TFIIIC triple barrel domain-containing protein n=1 Tax=Tieghemostelium lacteum TaxID=361077 RepID=A0A151ZIA6_TIELA|nr:hypothetical protein DLAC_04988 [Tieghemostelium lacteum]|eukprot:KYQ93610.1 hypothetical protein DLAC_04988 [Tieghemostelium lacteum]